MKNYYSLLPSSIKAKNELKTTIFKVFHLGDRGWNRILPKLNLLSYSYPTAYMRYQWKSLLRIYTSRWQDISSVSAKEPPFIRILHGTQLVPICWAFNFSLGWGDKRKTIISWKIHQFSGFYSKTISAVADAWMDVCTRVTWFTLKKYKSKPNL